MGWKDVLHYGSALLLLLIGAAAQLHVPLPGVAVADPTVCFTAAIGIFAGGLKNGLEVLMFDNFLIDVAAWEFDFTPAQVAEIENALPAIKRLVDLSDKTLPLIKQLEGYTAQATKDWTTVGPVVSMIVGVLKARTGR